MTRACWCGSTDLRPFSDHYRVCERCGTLVSTFDHRGDVSRVRNDDSDLYGRGYWFEHQERDLGFGNIHHRARTDLTERCVYWLKTLLTYQLPPARVLELGSAHGGFVAILRWAGFDATGLELSPSITAIARDLFQVAMLDGPIEDQDIEAGTQDVIALMDVLEHLPNPVQTMTHCLRLLKPGGFLLIQMPLYPEGKSFEALQNERSRFLELLKEEEHIYLYSAKSVLRFFADLGYPHVSFEPALFSHYDMFITVSREALAPIDAAVQEERLVQGKTGRLVLALIDLSNQLQSATTRLLEADQDRALRLAENERLHGALVESEADRERRLTDIAHLQGLLAESESDRERRLADIANLQRLLAESESDRERRLADIANLQRLLAESESDRAARLESINTLGASLANVEADRGALREANDSLTSQLLKLQADHGQGLLTVESLTAKVSQMEVEQRRIEDRDRQLEARLESVSSALADLSTRLWVRTGRRLGLLKHQ